MDTEAHNHGVAFCQVQGRHVFLDIARDRYFCLGSQIDQAFARMLAGGAVMPDQQAALVGAGILGPDATLPSPCRHRTAEGRIPISPAATRPVASFAVLMRRLCWTYRLRFLGLSRSIARIEQLRALSSRVGTNFESAARVARAHRGAAYIWSERDRCLPSALALMEDLIRGGVHARFVFGVHLDPFLAHCWVEVEGLLVRDDPDRVRAFQPILVI
jgi:hypothetical protein